MCTSWHKVHSCKQFPCMTTHSGHHKSPDTTPCAPVGTVVFVSGGGVVRGVSEQSYPRCCCNGLCCPVPSRPCSCPGPRVPLAHEVAVFGPCRSVPAWCVKSAVCTRQPPTVSMLARFRLPVCSSVHAWLLRLRTGPDFALECLPALDPALHVSAPVRRGNVAARVRHDVRSLYVFPHSCKQFPCLTTHAGHHKSPLHTTPLCRTICCQHR